MIKRKIDNLSLAAIEESGQCFRWKRVEGGYRIIAHGRVLYAFQKGKTGEIVFSCHKKEFDQVWTPYFDLNTEYQTIIRMIPKEDTHLRAAAKYGKGIRILRQEPWETLITFLISQRKNIPAIKQSVEKLCALAGAVIEENEGEVIHAFPTPQEMNRLSMDDLLGCSLGYRAKYIKSAAEYFCKDRARIKNYEVMDDDALLDALCELFGVGKKIALCTMLFGFHRLNSFPVDVWIDRACCEHYPNGFPIETYAPYAGVMQQYLFAYERHLAQNQKSQR